MADREFHARWRGSLPGFRLRLHHGFGFFLSVRAPLGDVPLAIEDELLQSEAAVEEFILMGSDEHCRALPVSGDEERSLCRLDLLDELLRFRAEPAERQHAFGLGNGICHGVPPFRSSKRLHSTPVPIAGQWHAGNRAHRSLPRAPRILGVPVRALVLPYPQLSADIDRPEDLELARRLKSKD
jgi:hypothetical protein